VKIAELEKRTGLSRHTLRYYEKIGLLKEVERHPNNYRAYPEKAVERMKMVSLLKELGFSVREITSILDALRSDSLNCEQGARLMAEKKAAVERKIAELEMVRGLLSREHERLSDSAEAQRKRGTCLRS
jgi:DNA-binding transcriptional MerR regulator